MSDFVAMNGIYAKYFSQPFSRPHDDRGNALLLGACVEIDRRQGLRRSTAVDLMKYTFHIVDVFSSTPFGNQLAVLPDAAGISTEGMQKEIAREFTRRNDLRPAEEGPFEHVSGAHLLTSGGASTLRGIPRSAQPVCRDETACTLGDPIRLILEENIGPVTVDALLSEMGRSTAR